MDVTAEELARHVNETKLSASAHDSEINGDSFIVSASANAQPQALGHVHAAAPCPTAASSMPPPPPRPPPPSALGSSSAAPWASAPPHVMVAPSSSVQHDGAQGGGANLLGSASPAGFQPAGLPRGPMHAADRMSPTAAPWSAGGSTPSTMHTGERGRADSGHPTQRSAVRTERIFQPAPLQCRFTRRKCKDSNSKSAVSARRSGPVDL